VGRTRCIRDIDDIPSRIDRRFNPDNCCVGAQARAQRPWIGGVEETDLSIMILRRKANEILRPMIHNARCENMLASFYCANDRGACGRACKSSVRGDALFSSACQHPKLTVDQRLQIGTMPTASAPRDRSDRARSPLRRPQGRRCFSARRLGNPSRARIVATGIASFLGTGSRSPSASSRRSTHRPTFHPRLHDPSHAGGAVSP